MYLSEEEQVAGRIYNKCPLFLTANLKVKDNGSKTKVSPKRPSKSNF